VAPDSIVFIVDDDGAVRDSLVTLLESHGYRALSFPSAETFVDFLEAPPSAGCLLLDVNLPGASGLTLLRRMSEKFQDMPILMITGMGQVAVAVEAMKAGALDFLEKPLDPDRLFALVDRALDISARASASTEERSRARARLDHLTPRELAVFEQLAMGRTNKQIAAELEISPRTVEIHRANLMDKLETSSVADLIRLSAAAGTKRDTGR
jgi:two-component system response regulator FixJ